MELGELEAEILGILETLGEASVRDVLIKIRKGKNLAYTTVSTTLDRLYKKGFIQRKGVKGRGGTKYIYYRSREIDVQRGIVSNLLNRLILAFGPSIVSSIYERLEEISPGKLAELKKEVEEGGKR